MKPATARKIIRILFLGLEIPFVLVPVARSQAPATMRGTPHVGFAYPAGGQQGTAFEVDVGGQNLTGTTTAVCLGGGVQMKVIGYERPMPTKDYNELRDRVQELSARRNRILYGAPPPAGATEKAPAGLAGSPAKDPPPPAENPGPGVKLVWTVDDQRTLTELRAKLLSTPNPNRLPNPAISETVRLQAVIAADARPGQRELRLYGAGGLSNPLVFIVGQYSEHRQRAVLETAAPENPQAANASPSAPPPTARMKPPVDVAIPVVLNGQILPGAIDRYRFAAKQGRQLVIAASARALMPYLADAVPGWFKATLTLRDATGREVAYDDTYRFNPDPLICYKVPVDGSYTLEVADSIYRGREDFVYRVSVGESPYITGAFPLGGIAGRRTSVSITGWNLSQDTVEVDAPDLESGFVRLESVNRGVVSNEVSFGFDSLPEVLASDSIATISTAQAVKPPVVINGRIGRRGETAVFAFQGRAGEPFVAEVVARRLDSPLDSVLRLTDAAGHSLAYNDDMDDKSDGLHTDHADSYLTATLPQDGTYYLHLGDIQRNGGPEYGYRLRLSEPRPDFDLRVTPSSVNVRSGGSTAITVHGVRRDGFSGPITLALVNAPEGFSLTGARIAAGSDSVQVTLSAPIEPLEGPATFGIVGQAQIGGKSVTRAAIPAEDMMQAFAYRHLVPSKALMVATVGRPFPQLRVKLAAGSTVRIASGGKATIAIGMPANPRQGILRLQLSDPPDGFTLENAAPAPGAAELVIACDATKAKPGTTGNLILQTYFVRAGGKAKAPAAGQSILLDTLPAIPFVVVSK